MAKLTREKREWLVSTMGEERVRRIEEGLDELSKEIQASGAKVAWKDFNTRVSAPGAGIAAAPDPTEAALLTVVKAFGLGGTKEKAPPAEAISAQSAEKGPMSWYADALGAHFKPRPLAEGEKAPEVKGPLSWYVDALRVKGAS